MFPCKEDSELKVYSVYIIITILPEINWSNCVNKFTHETGVLKIKWDEVRQQFPNCCVLVESVLAKTKNNEIIIEEMQVIGDCNNGNAAWKVYKKTHDEGRSRELYIFHTKNEKVKVIEQPYIGVHRKIYNVVLSPLF